MYQFNSEIDGLLVKLNKRTPTAGGLFRGGGLPRGGGLSNFRGGGIPKTKSGIPDGGYKKRPKIIRDEMERKAEETVVQEEGQVDDSDDDSDYDSGSEVVVQQQPTAVLAGQNTALGGSPPKPQPQRVQQLQKSSAPKFPLSPNTSQMINKGLASANIADGGGNRRQKYYFLRHKDNDDKQDWLYVGKGIEEVKTKMKTRSDTFLKAPYRGERAQKKLSGHLDGHEMLMVAGEAGLFYKSKFRTLDEFLGDQVAKQLPTTRQLREAAAASGQLKPQRLAMGSP